MTNVRLLLLLFVSTLSPLSLALGQTQAASNTSTPSHCVGYDNKGQTFVYVSCLYGGQIQQLCANWGRLFANSSLMAQLPAGLNCSGIMKTAIANCNGNLTCYSALNSSPPNSSINSTLGNMTSSGNYAHAQPNNLSCPPGTHLNTSDLRCVNGSPPLILPPSPRNQTATEASMTGQAQAARLYVIPDNVATAYDHKWQRAQILYGFNDPRAQAAGADFSLITCINELVKGGTNKTEPWCDSNLSYDYSQHNFHQANMSALATEYLEAKGILTKNDVNGTAGNNTAP